MTDGPGQVVDVHIFLDCPDEIVVFGDYPAVQFGTLILRDKEFSWVKLIGVGIESKESIDIAQGAEEPAQHFADSVHIKAGGGPGRGHVEQVPADGIGAILFKELQGIDSIALGFRHLFPFLIQDQVVNQHPLVGSHPLDEGGDGQQGIKPAPGLVDGFANKVCGKLAGKKLLVFKGIVVLGKGHGARVKPAVNDLGDPGHLALALGTSEMHIINIGPVQIQGIIHSFDGLFLQFRPGAHGFRMAALAAPDIQGSAPVAGAGKSPVVEVFQPVAEALFPHKRRIPFNSIVVFDQFVPEAGHLDIPAGLGVV